MEQIKQREGFKLVVFEPAKSRLERGECPSCGKPKKEWTRRKDWRCCSEPCTREYYQNYTTWSWADFRMKALARDNFTCVKCGDDRKEVEVLIKDRRIINWKERTAGKAEKFKYEFYERPVAVTNLIGDHITPIALGGDEWDLKNVQTLCIACNKIKTKEDARKIALLRKRIKIQTKEL